MSEQKLRNQEWRKSTKQTKLVECSSEFWNAGGQAFLNVEKEKYAQEPKLLIKQDADYLQKNIWLY